MSNDIESTSGNSPAHQAGRKYHYMSNLDDFDQWFDEIRRHWMQSFYPGRSSGQDWSVLPASRMPRLDIIDRETCFCVRAEIPGVDKNDLDVSLQDNVLCIQGSSQKEEQQEEKGQYFRRELTQGAFQRVVRLPGDVDGDQVKASFKDGILELCLQKSASAKKQTIPIE